jgi:hypothetical protein
VLVEIKVLFLNHYPNFNDSKKEDKGIDKFLVQSYNYIGWCHSFNFVACGAEAIPPHFFIEIENLLCITGAGRN